MICNYFLFLLRMCIRNFLYWLIFEIFELARCCFYIHFIQQHTNYLFFAVVVRRNRKVRNPLTHHIQNNAMTRDIVSTRTEMKKRTRERNGRSIRRFRIRSFTKYQLNTNNDERRRAQSPRRRIMEMTDDEESSASLSK